VTALDEEYLTVAEAAALLRVAPSTVRRWIRQGDVPAYRLGRRRVGIRRGDLAALIRPTRRDLDGRMHLAGEESVEIPRLTEEEKQRALAALERAQELAKRTQAERGGKLFSPSWEILAELREERARQLS
jgi:excisionase family DNA binding protein